MRRGIDRRGREARRGRKGTGTIDACMSYRRGPNCLPTGDVEPRAEDLFLRGWDREGGWRGWDSGGNQNHDAPCQHGSSRERKRFRRGVCLLLYGIIFFSVTSRPISPREILFFLFLLSFSFFFFFTACHDGDLSKSNSLFKSLFLSFRSKLESILSVLEEGLFSTPVLFSSPLLWNYPSPPHKSNDYLW